MSGGVQLVSAATAEGWSGEIASSSSHGTSAVRKTNNESAAIQRCVNAGLGPKSLEDNLCGVTVFTV